MSKHAEIIFDIQISQNWVFDARISLFFFSFLVVDAHIFQVLVVDAHISQVVHVLILCPGKKLLHEFGLIC